MPFQHKTIAVVNASGRQAASVIRDVTAVGFRVRAQMRNRDGIVAHEVLTNPNVKVIIGELYFGDPANSIVTVRGNKDVAAQVNRNLIDILFEGAQLAFINTTYYGAEEEIGKAIVDAAVTAGVEHFVYSSMPDHALYNPDWPSLPLWASKCRIEEYIRSTGIPSTFIYTGIYHNNFTTLPYPLYCMQLQSDGSFEWRAPFHPDVKLPWLDAEHDVGPAILQILKDGPARWGGSRIPLAYERMSPREACKAFSKGVGRPVRYKQGPIEVRVKLPKGYLAHLEALEQLFGRHGGDAQRQPPYFGDSWLDDQCIDLSWNVWEGPRTLEAYAREIFHIEERANGLKWMEDVQSDVDEDDDDSDDVNESDHSPTDPTSGLVRAMGGNAMNLSDDSQDLYSDPIGRRNQESWLA